MAEETTNGGKEGGAPANTNTGRFQWVPPSFNRMGSWYPWANLNDQMLDAYANWGKGAGAFANNAAPIWQAVKNAPGAVGGGLLGRSAYGGGPNPFGSYGPAAGAQYRGRGNGLGLLGGLPPGMTPGGPTAPPGTVIPPTQGGTGTNPGSLLPGTGLPPSWGAPPTNPSSPGTGLFPTQQGGAKTGTPPPPTGVPGVSAGGSQLPYSPGAQFDPGKGNTSVASMLSYFNSLPEAQRGNYINAIDQYSLGKGGANNLGAALQQALRGQMGQQQFDSWYAQNVTNKQGSGVGREGLPAWLLSALGG